MSKDYEKPEDLLTENGRTAIGLIINEIETEIDLNSGDNYRDCNMKIIYFLNKIARLSISALFGYYQLKKFILICSILLIITLTGCQDNQTVPKTSAQQTDNQPTPIASTQQPRYEMTGAKNMEIIQRNFDELNNSFTYVKEPIPPYVISQLSSGGDALPVVVSIHLEGLRTSSQYIYKIKYYQGADGSVRSDYKDFINYQSSEELKGYFAYKHLGKLKNNLHVLEISVSGGGSEIHKRLLFVRCVISEIDPGLPDTSILLNRAGEIDLGPNYAGEIKILQENNAVEIGADKFIPVKQTIKFNQ